MSRLSRNLLVLGAAATLMLATAPQTLASGKYRVVSRDPYTNTDAFHETEVEPDTYAFGSTIVSAFQMGRFPSEGATNLGFASSTDGGTTWRSGALPGTTVYADPPGPYRWASEPSVGYSARDGVWLISGVGAATSSQEVFVSRSTDAGTWEGPVTVAVGTFWSSFSGTWVTCDNWPSSPYFGTCYAEWSDATFEFQLHMAWSSDGGSTWTEGTVPTDWSGTGGMPVVGPDGKVVVAVDDEWYDPCCTYVSLDGGQNYSGPYFFHAGVSYRKVGGNLRSFDLPSVDIDSVGQMYLVVYSCQFRRSCSSNDIVLSTSGDGVHWSTWSRIPIEPKTSTADHFLPGIAVEPGTAGDHAHLAVTFWAYPDAGCDEAMCRLSVWIIQSPDGGRTWTTAVRMAGPFSNTWFPLTDSGYMVGDYSSVSFVPRGALSVFAVAQPSSCELGANDCREAMAAPIAPVRRA